MNVSHVAVSTCDRSHPPFPVSLVDRGGQRWTCGEAEADRGGPLSLRVDMTFVELSKTRELATYCGPLFKAEIMIRNSLQALCSLVISALDVKSATLDRGGPLSLRVDAAFADLSACQVSAAKGTSPKGHFCALLNLAAQPSLFGSSRLFIVHKPGQPHEDMACSLTRGGTEGTFGRGGPRWP